MLHLAFNNKYQSDIEQISFSKHPKLVIFQTHQVTVIKVFDSIGLIRCLYLRIFLVPYYQVMEEMLRGVL